MCVFLYNIYIYIFICLFVCGLQNSTKKVIIKNKIGKFSEKSLCSSWLDKYIIYTLHLEN